MANVKTNRLEKQIYKIPVLLIMFVMGLFSMAKFDPKNVSASNMDKITTSNNIPSAKISKQFKSLHSEKDVLITEPVLQKTGDDKEQLKGE